MRSTFPRHSPDAMAVTEAANRLGMREIDLFRLAYRTRWGQDIRDDRLEQMFAAYMFQQVVPYWLNQFAREVISRGEKIPAAIRASTRRYRPTPRKPARHGRLIVASVFAGMLIYGLSLTVITYSPDDSSPMECRHGPGLKWLTDLARMSNGRAPVECPQIGVSYRPPVRQ